MAKLKSFLKVKYALPILVLSVLFFGYLPNAFRWPVRLLIYLSLAVLIFGFCKAVIQVLSRRYGWLILLAVIIFNYILLEGVCYVFHAYKKKTDPDYVNTINYELSAGHRSGIERTLKEKGKYMIYDEELGWTINPGVKSKDGLRYFSSSIGTRGKREYELPKPKGVVRIACMGDSFTWGAEVKSWETWEFLSEKISDEFEFMNWGVNSYGLTQAYLRYQRKAKDLEPDYVMLGFISRNLLRTVNVFRPFLQRGTGVPLAKPYAKLRVGELLIEPNFLQPLQKYQDLLDKPYETLLQLAKRDYLMRNRIGRKSFNFPSLNLASYAFSQAPVQRRIYDIFDLNYKSKTSNRFNLKSNFSANSYPLRTNVALIKKFSDEVKADGKEFIFLIFPTRDDMKNYNSKKEIIYKPMLAELRKNGIFYLEALKWFTEKYGEKIPIDDLYRKSHFSPLGNQLIAENLIKYFNKQRVKKSKRTETQNASK